MSNGPIELNYRLNLYIIAFMVDVRETLRKLDNARGEIALSIAQLKFSKGVRSLAEKGESSILFEGDFDKVHFDKYGIPLVRVGSSEDWMHHEELERYFRNQLREYVARDPNTYEGRVKEVTLSRFPLKLPVSLRMHCGMTLLEETVAIPFQKPNDGTLRKIDLVRYYEPDGSKILPVAEIWYAKGQRITAPLNR